MQAPGCYSHQTGRVASREGLLKALVLGLCDAVRCQTRRVASLEGLPEELVLELFEAVLRRGKLQPRVLALFEVRVPGIRTGFAASTRGSAALGTLA